MFKSLLKSVESELLPVSYTHLDVYKRQLQHTAVFRAGGLRYDPGYSHGYDGQCGQYTGINLLADAYDHRLTVLNSGALERCLVNALDDKGLRDQMCIRDR